MSVSAFLAEGLPQQKEKPGIPIKNRFLALRERNRSTSSQRGASPHKRRRGDSEMCDSESDDNGASGADPNKAFKSMADEEASFKKAREIVEGVKKVLGSASEEEISSPLKKVLSGIVEWMDITTGVQVTTASVVVDSFAKVISPRKSRADDMEKPKRMQEEEVKTQEERDMDEKMKKFLHEVKEAERSVLVFKTNMGTVPAMNPDTMRKKFSANMSAKAAAVEKPGECRPSAKVVAQLDGTLSMVTRMEYFGRETKKATRINENKEKVEEDYYTIPVKLSFKDKKTREAAEVRIRTLCKMYGTVPYHRTLRNALNTIIEECKQKYKGDYIQTRLVADKMQVKISRRDKDGTWFDNVEVVDLPYSVLETGREAGLKPRVTITRMETEESQGSQG
jgi:hypothetical protein